MPSGDPRNWFDKAVGVCLGILVGSAALFIAVKLIEAVAIALIVIIGVAAFVGIGYAALRARNRGW